MENIREVYTDGGIIGVNGRGGSKRGGTWAWCGLDYDGNRVMEKSGVLLPDPRYPELKDGITNNHTEFFAFCNALRYLPDDWGGVIYTDSETCITRFKNRKKRKAMRNTPKVWQEWFWKRLERMPYIVVKHVKGHSGIAGNEWCDSECTRLAGRKQPANRAKSKPQTVSFTVERGLIYALGE